MFLLTTYHSTSAAVCWVVIGRRKSGNETMTRTMTWVPTLILLHIDISFTLPSESHSGKAHKPTPPPAQHHPQPFIPKAAKPTGSFANLPQKVHSNSSANCPRSL